MSGFDCLGCDEEIGFDAGGLIQALAPAAQYGISAYEQDKKETAAKESEQKSASAVIAADREAALAVTKAETSAQLKQPSAQMDAVAAQRMLAAQDKAAMGLSPGAMAKRAEAADKALDAAISDAQKNPKDGYKAALVKAWTLVANKAHSGAIAMNDAGRVTQAAGESWFTRPAIGSVPGYGVLLGGAGVLGALGFVVKKFLVK